MAVAREEVVVVALEQVPAADVERRRLAAQPGPALVDVHLVALLGQPVSRRRGPAPRRRRPRPARPVLRAVALAGPASSATPRCSALADEVQRAPLDLVVDAPTYSPMIPTVISWMPPRSSTTIDRRDARDELPAIREPDRHRDAEEATPRRGSRARSPAAAARWRTRRSRRTRSAASRRVLSSPRRGARRARRAPLCVKPTHTVMPRRKRLRSRIAAARRARAGRAAGSRPRSAWSSIVGEPASSR